MNANATALESVNLRKVYRRGSEDIIAVNDVSLSIRKGEFVSFVGPSGSGKTTLLNILGCLDNPTSGTLRVNGWEIFKGEEEGKLSESKLTQIRRQVFGYIFQKFYLIPTLTVLENVYLPYAFYKKENVSRKPEDILKFLGLENRMKHRPGELSGGEMQRVAIARALINDPRILLADEPTGNLDTQRSQEIGAILRSLNQEEGLTILLVTHNLSLSRIAQRTIEMRDGQISVPPAG